MMPDPSAPIPNKFTEKVRSAFLLALAASGSVRGASGRIGVHFSTIYEHAKSDPTFADAIERARAEWEQGLVEKIVKAGEVGSVIERRNGTKVEQPGDWRALAWALEHSPATRERYAGILRQKVEVGGSEDMPPIQSQHTETHEIEIGPETMDRLQAVVMVLVKAGRLRLPDPNEIEGEATEVDPE